MLTDNREKPAPRQATFEMKRQEDGTFYVTMHLTKLTVTAAAALAKVFQQYNEKTPEEGSPL